MKNAPNHSTNSGASAAKYSYSFVTEDFKRNNATSKLSTIHSLFIVGISYVNLGLTVVYFCNVLVLYLKHTKTILDMTSFYEIIIICKKISNAKIGNWNYF